RIVRQVGRCVVREDREGGSVQGVVHVGRDVARLVLLLDHVAGRVVPRRLGGAVREGGLHQLPRRIMVVGYSPPDGIYPRLHLAEGVVLGGRDTPERVDDRRQAVVCIVGVGGRQRLERTVDGARDGLGQLVAVGVVGEVRDIPQSINLVHETARTVIR